MGCMYGQSTGPHLQSRPPAPITVEDCSRFDGKFQYRDAHPDGSASTDEEECERCPSEDSEVWACDGWHRDVTATVLGEEKAYYWYCENDSSQFEIPECAVVCKSRAPHRPKTEMSPSLGQIFHPGHPRGPFQHVRKINKGRVDCPLRTHV